MNKTKQIAKQQSSRDIVASILDSKITPKERKKLIKDNPRWEKEFVKVFLEFNPSRLLSFPWETKSLIKKYGNIEIERLNASTSSKREKLGDEKLDTLRDISKNLSLNTRSHLLNSLPEGKKYIGYSMTLCDELEKEYEVKTASQKMIVQKIVSAEIRLLYYQGFAGEIMDGSSIYATVAERGRTELHINKIIDMAHRQIQSGIEQLKTLTTPPMKIKFIQEQVSNGEDGVTEKKKVVQEFSNPQKQ